MRNLSILLGLSFLLAGLAQGQGKIVFIDLDKTFEGYTKTKSADQNLKSQAQEFERDKQRFLDEYKVLDETYNKHREDSRNPIFSRERQDAAAASGEKVLLQKRELESKIRQFEKERKRQLEETMRRTRKRLVEDIQQVVREYSLANSISAVIDTSGPSLHGFPTVVFADSTADITDRIIELLNRP